RSSFPGAFLFRPEVDRLSLLRRPPGVDPALQPVETGPALSERFTAHSIGVEETLFMKVGHREVRQVELAGRPAGGIFEDRRMVVPLPEEGQLIAVLPAVRGQLAGEVPPFGPERRVRPVVFREGEAISRLGEFKGNLRRAEAEEGE